MKLPEPVKLPAPTTLPKYDPQGRRLSGDESNFDRAMGAAKEYRTLTEPTVARRHPRLGR